jgi:hypothetical protein
MSCCGKKREALKQSVTLAQDRPIRPSPPLVGTTELSSGDSTFGRQFHNAGRADLSIRGPVSGRIYHFSAKGATVLVDERDIPYLTGISRIEPGPKVRTSDNRRPFR